MARRLPIGAELADHEQGIHVRVWAPERQRVTLVIEGPARRELVLAREVSGHHSGFAPGVRAGARYWFRLDDEPTLVPDPASRFQPEGPLGPSEVIDPSTFRWTDATWRGLPVERLVIYELHIGTFTPEGTWAAAAEQLEYLAAVGITMLEVMPVNEWSGRYNWGYDGVCFYAPAHSYGTPDDLRRFVDRAHACGIAVILDVVYNHIGPAGNTLFAWSPHYKHETAGDWGDAFNFDGHRPEGMRELVIENAGYWISEFHLDGLRLDALQAIQDRSGDHVVAALCRRARAAAPDRRIFIVGEDEPQDVELLAMGVDALWNDDFHHTARIAATGVRDAYLHDYAGTPQELISAIKRGFLYQGQLYPWQKQPRGTSTRGLARNRFVHFLENHDQCANMGVGERLAELATPAMVRAMTALLLLSPQPPMLFQGQETGTRTRWKFFVDHRDELADAVRKGRAEFKLQFAAAATPEGQAALPDPCDEATFRSCVLDPAERRLDAPMVALHRDLLALRHGDPAFTDPRPEALDGAVLSDRAFLLRYQQDTGDRLLLVNLGAAFQRASVPEPLLAPPTGCRWRLAWSSEDPRYGGHGTPDVLTDTGLAIPAHAAVLLASEVTP